MKLTEVELANYAVEAVANEVWSDEVGDFVLCKEDEIERMTWYKIPASIVNSVCRIRLITPDEIRDIQSNLLDELDKPKPSVRK
jgi:hypothetical protein